MSEPVKFEFDLLDKFSGVADRMSASLARFERSEERARKSTEALDVEIGKLSALGGSVDLDKFGKLFAGGAAAGAFTFGIAEGVNVLVEGIGKAIDLAEELVSKAADFTAEWIQAGAESEKLTLAQNLTLGKEQASRLREYTGGIKIGGYDDDAIAKAVLPLVNAGVSGQRLKDIAAAAGDVEALTAGQMKFDAAREGFKRVQTGERLTAKMVQGFGLQVSEVFGRLGEALGMKPEAALKKASKGGIAVDDLMNALFASIAARTSRGLGSGGRDLADTVDAKLQRLRDLPENYLKKIAQSAGYAQFSSFLDRVLEKLDPEGPTGKRILAGLEHLGDKVLSLFDGISSDTLDNLVDSLIGMGETLIDITPSLRTVGELLGTAATMARGLWEITTKLTEGAVSLFSSGMLDLGGGEIVAGMERGLRGALAGKRPGRAMAEDITDDVRDALEIRSPSRVFMDLGEQAGRGFALGVPEGAGDTAATLTPAAPALALAGSRSITISFGGITVTGANAREQAESLTSEIERILPGALSRLVDHEAEAGGVA